MTPVIDKTRTPTQSCLHDELTITAEDTLTTASRNGTAVYSGYRFIKRAEQSRDSCINGHHHQLIEWIAHLHALSRASDYARKALAKAGTN